MDNDELRMILDGIDERVYAFIETSASLDEIADMIAHRNDRRMQAMGAYVDGAFAREEEEPIEEDDVKPRSGRRRDSVL